MATESDVKANRTPRAIRLKSRIASLFNMEQACWVKIRRGNPYLKCKHCGITNVEETYKGHHPGCRLKGIKKEIAHYQHLLEEENANKGENEGNERDDHAGDSAKCTEQSQGHG
jgi:hypothetical protein